MYIRSACLCLTFICLSMLHPVLLHAAPGTERASGRLILLVEDLPDTAAHLYFIESDTGRLPLRIDEEVDARLIGHRVEAAGRRALENGHPVFRAESASHIVLAADDPTVTASATTSVQPVAGAQRTLVMMVNYSNAPIEPWTSADAHALVFDTANAFVQENSYGNAWLTGDVAGWITVDQTNDTCNLHGAGEKADEWARSNGMNPDTYDRLIYLFAEPTCVAAGMGTIGATPSRAYVDGYLNFRTVVHELGHNFGLRHSRALDCGIDRETGDCRILEYGDTMDTMGSPDAGHYNAFQKHRIAWVEPAHVTRDGTYELAPLEANSPLAKAIRIPGGMNEETGNAVEYYLEYRQPIGFDSFLSDRSYVSGRQDVTHGIVVHRVESGATPTSDILHMNYSPYNSRNDWWDPALPVSQNYTTSFGGISLTVLDATSASATVDVAFTEPNCTTPPELQPTQSPVPIVSDTTQTIVFTAEDGNVSSCGSKDFDVQFQIPEGWNADYPARISLPPQEPTQLTASLHVPPGATPGDHHVEMSLTRTDDTRINTVASVTIEVVAANHPPVVTNDAVTLATTAEVEIHALDNDWDPDGDWITIRSVSGAKKGQASIASDRSISYTPNRNAKGEDALTYVVSDGVSEVTGQVTIQFGARSGKPGRGKNK